MKFVESHNELSRRSHPHPHLVVHPTGGGTSDRGVSGRCSRAPDDKGYSLAGAPDATGDPEITYEGLHRPFRGG